MNLNIKQIAELITNAFKPVAVKLKKLEGLIDNLDNKLALSDKSARNALHGLEQNSQEIKQNYSFYTELEKKNEQQTQLFALSIEDSKQKLADVAKDILSQATINKNVDQALMQKIDKDDFIKELTSFKRNQAQGVEPYNEKNNYLPGESVSFNGGVYQVVNKTNSEPGSTANWLLTQNGVKGCTAKNHSLVFELTNGEQIELSDLKGEKGDSINFCGLHQKGSTYKKNDICVTDGAAWIALKETTATPPLNDWKLFVKRGPRGKQGPAVDDNKLNNLIDNQLTKMMVNDVEPLIQKAFDQAVNGSMEWAGIWKPGPSYSTGNLVRVGSALFIATGPSKGRPPEVSPDDWAFVIRNTSGGGSSGGGSGAVQSVFGRSGNVVATYGDYLASEIEYDDTLTGIGEDNVQGAIDYLAVAVSGLYQIGVLRNVGDQAKSLDDVDFVLLDVFNEIVIQKPFVTADLATSSLTVTAAGVYEVAIALNVSFQSGDTLDVTAYINGTVTNIDSLSVKGEGTTRPISIYWSSVVFLPANSTLDLRAKNGAAGTLSMTVLNSKFSIEYKGQQ